MIKKYELTNQTTTFNDITLYRIRALQDFGFGDVKKGDLGGYIQSEENLSHNGDCWVYGDAMVFENAKVNDDTKVGGSAKVYNNVLVGGNAMIYDTAEVFGNAFIQGNTKIYGDAKVYGNAKLIGDIDISDNATIFDDARLVGVEINFKITPKGKTLKEGGIYISGDTKIYENAQVVSTAHISGRVEICGDVIVYGKTLNGIITIKKKDEMIITYMKESDLK